MMAKNNGLYRSSNNHGQRSRRHAMRLPTFALAGLLATLVGATAHAQPSMLIGQELNLIEPDEIVNLGATVIGETSGHLFRLLNVGDEVLIIDSIEVDGDFAFLFDAEAANTQISPGSETVLTVLFTAEGNAQFAGRGARVTVRSNDPDHPNGYAFLVSAVLTDPPQPVMQVVFDDVVVGNNGLINLGDVDVGQAVEFDVRIESIGSDPVTITDVRFEEVDAAADTAATDYEHVSGFNQTIEPQASAVYTFRVSPTAGGTRRALLVIENDSLQNPYAITVVTNAIGEAELPPPPPEFNEPTPEPDDEGDPNEQPAPDDEANLDDPFPPDEVAPPMPMPCGAGLMGMVPMMMAGLCSARIGTAGMRRRRLA